jgi:hypothetical protein
MIVRSETAQKLAGVKPAQFSVLGCEVAVPAGSVAAVLDGKPLPLARPNPQRIVIFGDSGCRLFNGATAQACNDPNSWPFPKITRSAAAFAAPVGAQSNDLANKVLQLALGSDMPAGVRMIVSGHVHAFQAVDFGGMRPPQLVVGTGGDTLNLMPPMSVAGTNVNGGKVVNFATHSGFGYMVWDRLDNIWVGTLFDVDGKAITHCRLVDRSLRCGS